MAQATPSNVLLDGRDHYNLFYRRLVNRQLFEQLSDESQGHRLGNTWEQVAAAADTRVASQQRLDGGEQSRFHGLFIFDSFVAVRPFYGFDANLNLTLFNPSASDGYRVSAFAMPGGTLHFYHEHAFEDAGQLRFDLFAADLDVVTLGGGLLLETTPTEGVIGNLDYEGFNVRYFFGGRVFWSSDDLIAYSVGAFDGKLDLSFVDWTFSDTDSASRYLQLSARWPFWERRLQLVGEVGARLPRDNPYRPSVLPGEVRSELIDERRDRARTGALARADYVDSWSGVSWHLGYQFRWYEHGYGPRAELDPPTTTYNLPFREESYVTNSFEYFLLSPFFDQWSHTAMAELQVPLGDYFRVFGEAEYVSWFLRDPNLGSLTTPLSERAFDGLWYRGGLRLHPWPDLPHRLSAVFTNKQVASPANPREPTSARFTRGNFVVLQMELYL